jgi:hypothetical protein
MCDMDNSTSSVQISLAAAGPLGGAPPGAFTVIDPVLATAVQCLSTSMLEAAFHMPSAVTRDKHEASGGPWRQRFQHGQLGEIH